MSRKRWMATVIAESKKDTPALPFARQVRSAKTQQALKPQKAA